MVLFGEHPAILFVHCLNVENDEEIDRAEFEVDHRRPADAGAESQIHIEKRRQFDIKPIVNCERCETVSLRQNPELFVKVSVAR